MKYLAIASFAGLALAGPIQKRQNIDFAAYNAIPSLPDVAAPIGDPVPAVVPDNLVSAAAQAAAAAVTNVAAATVTGSVAAVTNVPTRRSPDEGLLKRAACAAQAAGGGPSVSNPDTATAFTAYPAFGLAATSATTPAGYAAIVVNATASASDPTYLSYMMLSTYDVASCAAFCGSKQACNSFNICT